MLSHQVKLAIEPPADHHLGAAVQNEDQEYLGYEPVCNRPEGKAACLITYRLVAQQESVTRLKASSLIILYEH